jgi:pyruvate dehydrogenase E1 component beta subunit
VRTPEFHPDAIEAQFVQQPGIKVVCPSNPYDAKGLLIEAIRDPDPVLFLEPQRLYRIERVEVPDGDYQIPFGQARLAREGKDLLLIAWSAAVELSLKAAEQLASAGIQAAVLDLRTLVPLDVDGLLQAASSSGRVVIVHEAPFSGGFGAEIVATLQHEAFMALDAPVERVTAWDTPYPPGSLENYYLPSVTRIVEAAQRAVAY